MHKKKPEKIAIIGGGAAGLLAADLLSSRFGVDLYEKERTVGRKLLVAGKGGFNLSNAATGAALTSRYEPAGLLDAALEAFDTQATRDWLQNLGIPTFVGSSGRVFPEAGIKPAQVLQRIKERLLRQGVRIHCQHEFTGFTNQARPRVRHGGREWELPADRYLFALGGASWPVTGANTRWPAAFAKLGIQTLPFQSSNCGVNIRWPEELRAAFAGSPLKNLQARAGHLSLKGEALITDYGLEGNVIYPLVPAIRQTLAGGGEALLHLDFKPQNSLEQLIGKTKAKNLRPKHYEQVFHLSKAQLALLKGFTTKPEYLNPEAFAVRMKDLVLPVLSLRPVPEAISTVGGIASQELHPDFSLKAFPHLVVMGEMIDWDAPTGGFLLQGCFATAAAAARALLAAGE
ncbi:MAG: TIGR03862 family flavoprotein [Adhaeribacter sp.]